MNIGVLLSRRTYLKTFGPVISEALSRGHGVTAILDYDGKRGEAIRVDDLAPYPTLTTTQGGHMDVILGQQFKRPDHPAPYVYIGQYYDNLAFAPPTDYTMMYHSEHHWKLHYALYGMNGSPPPVVGWLAGDHLPQIYPHQVRRRYRLEDKKVWLLFPPKAPIPQYREIIRALIARAKMEEATLVVKYRLKSYRPWFAYFVGDRRVWDESMYPHTSLELMSIADRVIHFDSGAGYEAAYCGKYAISIAMERPPAWRTAWVEYSHELGSRLQWPGVNTALTHREAVQFLQDTEWPRYQVHPEAQAAFIQKFLGPHDHKSAARVVDCLEAMYDPSAI